jgi:hypothetical protein
MFKKHKPARWVYVSFVNWDYDDEEDYEMF